MVGDRAGRSGIVGSVEPELRSRGQQIADRARPEQLQPRRPFRPAHCGAERGLGDCEARLVAQHRHGEAGIGRLVRAGEAGKGQIEAAVPVAIMEAALAYLGMPGAAPRQP